MKRFFALTVALTALVGLTLSVAGPERYSKEVVPVPECDWSGLYLGLHAGGGTQQVQVTDDNYLYSFDTLTVDDTNVLLGGQLGYNWQHRAAVFGIEADGSWTNLEARNTVTVLNQGSPEDFFSRGGEIEFMGTVRARAGLAYENVLAYVTAGVAFANGERSAHFNNAPDQTGGEDVRWNAEEFRLGWTAGVGVEYMVNCHWTVRLETLFTDFESDDHVRPTLGPETASRFEDFTYSFDDKMWQARLGVNYKFGGGR